MLSSPDGETNEQQQHAKFDEVRNCRAPIPSDGPPGRRDEFGGRTQMQDIVTACGRSSAAARPLRSASLAILSPLTRSSHEQIVRLH
jgi:hypothetical protein